MTSGVVPADGRATPDATGSSLIVSAGLDIVLMGVCGTMREDVEKVSKQLRLESTAGIHVWKIVANVS